MAAATRADGERPADGAVPGDVLPPLAPELAGAVLAGAVLAGAVLAEIVLMPAPLVHPASSPSPARAASVHAR
jgi:hypothetical protein